MQKGASKTAIGAEEWFAERRAPAESSATRIFDVGDLWAVLKSARRLIAMTVAATTVMALAAGILMPKRYSTSTQLYVDSRGIKVLSNDVGPQAAAETAIAEFESQLKILGSGSVMQRVAERERLASDPTFFPQPGPLNRLRSLLLRQPDSDIDRTKLAAALLERSVAIRRSDRSFVVDVVVTDSDPARAARLAQAISEVYLESQLTNRRDLARRLGGEVSGRLQDLRERVEAAERRLNDFKSANNLVFSGGGLVTEQDLTELNNQLNQARARTARAKARIDQLNRLSGNTGTAATAEVLDSPTIVQLRIRLAEANRQAAEARRNLGPLHPEIQTADARVREANAAIASEVDRRRASVRNDYDQLLAAERLLANQINELKTKSSDTGQALIGLRELERAVEANKKVYEEFLLRSRELSEQQGIFANGSYIITPAAVPSQPVGISLPMLLALGFVAGFPLGGGLALVRSQIIRSPRNLLSRQSPSTASRSQPHKLASIARSDLENYLARNCLVRVAVPSDLMADFAQSVENAMPSGGSTMLLIVSANASASGAEVSAALAACWAYEGYEVLVADADASRSRFSELSGVTRSSGLFDRLHRNVDELIQWGRNGLPHILPALDPSQRKDINGARRIVTQRLEDMTAMVDTMIVDAGELGGNAFAPALLRMATAAIVVTDAIDPGGRQALSAVAQLDEAQVPLLGIVTVTGGAKPASIKPSRSIFSRLRRKPDADVPSTGAPAAVKGA